MARDVHIFGIRHHGPGSARRLVEALRDLRPSRVLIEGPTDATPLLPMLADPEMQPPVALLTYATDDPSKAIFWPFAVYSPEYQAVQWAVQQDIDVAFIDLPAAWRLASMEDAAGNTATMDPNEESLSETEEDAGDDATAYTEDKRDLHANIRLDPVGELARAAGYEDGESWWQDVIEENPTSGPVFEAIADAMTVLREYTPNDKALPDAGEEEDAREAHMRLQIAKASKEVDGPIAVVCGAWHVPALHAKHTAKDDRGHIKGRKKTKMTATWAPWTAPRLASGSGYGAGVTAPGWCDHLWHATPEDRASLWLAKIATAMRRKGHIVSTASIIEAQRLGRTLAVLRDRPSAGFEELRDAAVSCLCFGEDLLWQEIAPELLIGSDVGTIPSDVPLAPLLEDLQRRQRKIRLKPEALERDLAIDLRSESGLARSTLLHQLAALDVPWGKLRDAGRSRGTFRERWTLRWEPEYAVKLVEHLVFGPTIVDAATGRTMARLRSETKLGTLAELVETAMTAQLEPAVVAGIDALARRAAQTSDCLEMMSALPPLANVIRYGQARKNDANALLKLADRITVQAALALPYAARGLDATAAKNLADQVLATNEAVRLIVFEGDGEQTWHDALRTTLNDAQTTRLVSGVAARLLYEADELTAEEAAVLLSRMLSPGTPVMDAAGFFEGFFEGAGQRLIFDDALRDAVGLWVASLDGDTFTENLPLFRRVLSSLDRTERKHLFDRLFGTDVPAFQGLEFRHDGAAAWNAHFPKVVAILTGEPLDD